MIFSQTDPITVEDFLNQGGDGFLWIAATGRSLTIVSLLLAFGLALFLRACLRPQDDVTLAVADQLETIIMVAGILVALGAAAEFSEVSASANLTWEEVVSAPQTRGPLIRFGAGIALAFALLASGTARFALLVFGGVVGAVSFAVDGHTVSEGPRLLHFVTNLIHVHAAATWLGGLVGLGLSLLRLPKEKEDGEEGTGHVVNIVHRFSRLATLSLVPVLVAGVVMTQLIIDGPGDLVSSSWGQVLLIKTTLVLVAIGGGAYNHFVLAPVTKTVDSQEALGLIQRVVLIEACLVVAAAATTGFLVGASPT